MLDTGTKIDRIHCKYEKSICNYILEGVHAVEVDVNYSGLKNSVSQDRYCLGMCDIFALHV